MTNVNFSCHLLEVRNEIYHYDDIGTSVSTVQLIGQHPKGR